MNYETSKEIETALAWRWVSPRTHLIIPNVSWGFHFYDREIDLLIVTRSLYAWEVEIKVSHSDLIRDQEKKHGHLSNRIKRLYFAVPEILKASIDDIPARAGFIVVNKSGFITTVRDAEDNMMARKVTERECYQLARLGTIRYWSLRKKGDK